MKRVTFDIAVGDTEVRMFFTSKNEVVNVIDVARCASGHASRLSFVDDFMKVETYFFGFKNVIVFISRRVVA